MKLLCQQPLITAHLWSPISNDMNITLHEQLLHYYRNT